MTWGWSSGLGSRQEGRSMVSALKELLEWGGGRASPHRKLKAVGVVRHRARHPTAEDPGKDSQRREHLMGGRQIDVGW